jgi:hypothetical protein
MKNNIITIGNNTYTIVKGNFIDIFSHTTGEKIIINTLGSRYFRNLLAKEKETKYADYGDLFYSLDNVSLKFYLKPSYENAYFYIGDKCNKDKVREYDFQGGRFLVEIPKGDFKEIIEFLETYQKTK